MFYLTLPSNSSLGYFPNNSASHFITKLPQSQELNGEYEVGLAEIQFSNSYQNVTENKVYFEYELHERKYNEARTIVQNRVVGIKRIGVPNGLYESNKYFITVLNKLCAGLDQFNGGTKDKRILKFFYNQASRRASITKYQDYSYLRLSEALSEILGCPENMANSGYFPSSRTMDLDQNVKSIFVYSDLVQPRPVGDAVVPLLRSLPPVDKSKDTVHYLFEKPHYIPLGRFQFDTVEILLTSDKGEKISFDNGHCIVTLHFRRRRLT